MTDRNERISAGVPPAVTGASRPRFGEVTIRDRGRLPHWEQESATYFITLRLTDSLPKTLLEKIESERKSIVNNAKTLGRKLSPDEQKRLRNLSTARVENCLDAGAGTCHLRNPAIADAVRRTLLYFDDKRYRRFGWCVMPNHVHVVLRLFPRQQLAWVIHSWKSFSAKEANRILGQHGAFWQREYYDHLVRNEIELERALRYLAENPVKAGPVNWGWVWVWVWGRDAPTTAGKMPALQARASEGDR
ncbi:MAG TPA: transposase [Terriglobales bacterium]|nr:transposase [Terriglobales bacterium]